MSSNTTCQGLDLSGSASPGFELRLAYGRREAVRRRCWATTAVDHEEGAARVDHRAEALVVHGVVRAEGAVAAEQRHDHCGWLVSGVADKWSRAGERRLRRRQRCERGGQHVEREYLAASTRRRLPPHATVPPKTPPIRRALFWRPNGCQTAATRSSEFPRAGRTSVPRLEARDWLRKTARTGCRRDGHRERAAAGGEEVLAQGTCLCMTRRLGTNVPSSHPAACRRLAGPPAWLRGQTAARARRWDRMVEVSPSRASARLPCLPRVRMAALDGSALPGGEDGPWAPPRVLRRRRFPRWPSLATAAPHAAPVAAPHAAPCPPCRASAAQARRTS